MYIEELIIIIAFVVGIYLYRNYKGDHVGKYVLTQVQTVYDKFAPYSFKVVREKTKQLGQEYTPRQYAIQVTLFAGFASVVTYLYFYNLIISIIYAIAAVAFVPYITYLRCKKVYSEFLFEQIQVYTSNTIMEFATTQSFVKSLEGVANSGILEDPVLADVRQMITMSYDNGTIDEALDYMSKLYPYYIVKNMHQLFLQITKEGAQNSADSLENMQQDIDMLVESVYRDRIERASFHKSFLQFGIMLYLMVMLVQYLLGRETYILLLNRWYIKFLLHAVLIINSYFLLKGENTAMIKKEGQGAHRTEIAVKLVENGAHVCHCARSIVSQGVNKDGDSMRTISLVSHLFEVTLVFAHGIFDSTVNIVLRHILALRIGNDCT